MRTKKRSRTWHAGKPKLKPDYNAEAMMEKLLDVTVQLYRESAADGLGTPSLRRLARELSERFGAEDEKCYGISPIKARKLLITAGVYESENDNYKTISELRRRCYAAGEIAGITGLPASTVNSYLPYAKGVYKMDEVGGERSVGAERVKRFREKAKEEPNK